MKTFKNVLVPVFSMLLAGGCDDSSLQSHNDFAENASFRDGPSGGLGNGPVIGVTNTSVMPKDFDEDAVNYGGTITFTSGRILIQNYWLDVEEWWVDKTGELHVSYWDANFGVPVLVTVDGEDVDWLEFTVDVDTGGANPETGTMLIVEPQVEVGTVPNYKVFTSIENEIDPEDYPESTVYPSEWPLCRESLGEDEGLGNRTHAVVFGQNVRVTYDANANDLDIEADNQVDMMGCLGDTLVKPQDLLDVHYDHEYDPHTRALADDEQNKAINHAFRAFHDGESYTVPGQTIWLEDLSGQDLFDASNAPVAAQLEGVYLDGMLCRGAAGIHRYIPSGKLNDTIDGYSNIPVCPQDLSTLNEPNAIAVYANSAG